jgi:hypothetical protein
MVQSEMVTFPVFRRSATAKSSRYWSRLILCYKSWSVSMLCREEMGSARRT